MGMFIAKGTARTLDPETIAANEWRIKAVLGPDELIGWVPALGIIVNPFYGQPYSPSGSAKTIEILGPPSHTSPYPYGFTKEPKPDG